MPKWVGSWPLALCVAMLTIRPAQIAVAPRNLPSGAVDPRAAALCQIAARERVCGEA